MKNKKQNYADVGFLFYIFTAAVTLVIFFCSLFLEKPDNVPAMFADKWYYDIRMTEPADLKHPQLNDGVCTFYTYVPGNIETGDCLWFKSKNAYITVKVGNEVRARIKNSDLSYLYGKTPGTDWVCVPLNTPDVSEVISINFITNYNDNSAYIDSVYIGNTVSAFRFAFSDRIVGTVLCILLMFSSTVLIIVFCVLNRHIKDMPKELLYLGACVFFAALWSLSELRVLQLFTEKSAGLFHNLTCMTLTLFIMPLVYYYRNDLDRKCRFIVPVMTLMTILNFAVCSILHFSGIADFHETLIVTHITIGSGAACVLYANFLRCFKNPERKKADIPPAVCMILVRIAAFADIFRYSGGGINDSSFYSRIAIFAYAVSLAIRSLIYVIEMVKRGMRAEIISRLAYEDGLTGLGNRTAYSEKIEKINGVPSTIFVFDINNLKYVNDNMGHQLGDVLIKTGAELISSIFGKIGECYRIGGDEFVCLAKGNIPSDEHSEEFYEKIDNINLTGELEFPLMIALGCEFYDGTGDVKDIIDSADKKMYERKAELKKEKKFPLPSRS